MQRLIQSILRADRHIGAVLDLEYGRRLYHLDAVPLPFWNVYTEVSDRGIQQIAFGLAAEVVVEDHHHPAAQQNVGLRRMGVSVNGEYGARQQDIDETLCLGIERLMEIEVHAETRTLGRLLLYLVEKFVVDYHMVGFQFS